MSQKNRDTFTPADIRAIRLLVLVNGGIAVAMLLVTDREAPLLVFVFITVVTFVPIAAIYLLRRLRAPKKRGPDQAPGG